MRAVILVCACAVCRVYDVIRDLELLGAGINKLIDSQHSSSFNLCMTSLRFNHSKFALRIMQ